MHNRTRRHRDEVRPLGDVAAHRRHIALRRALQLVEAALELVAAQRRVVDERLADRRQRRERELA